MIEPIATNPLPGSKRPVPYSLLAIGFLGTLVLGLTSDGVYHDDDLTHFLMARWARWFPGYLLHTWGRPGFTIPVAAVAWMGESSTGWHAARILSALITAASAYLAVGVARHCRIRRLWLVVLLCYLQPLNALLAATTLTEPFAAFYLIASVRLLQIQRPLLASAVFGIALITRHETVALLPVWWFGLALIRERASRKIASFLLSLAAFGIHQILFQAVFEEWPLRIFSQPRGSTEYPPAGVLSYLPHALYAITPFISGLALAGGLAIWRMGGRLPVLLSAAFFLVHVLITDLGLFASGGYGRFMVSIAPLIAVLAAAGMEQILERHAVRGIWISLAVVWSAGLIVLELEQYAGRISIPANIPLLPLRGFVLLTVVLALTAAFVDRRGLRQMVSSAVLMLMASATLIQFAVIVRPLRLRPAQIVVLQCADWIDSNFTGAPLFATNPWMSHFLGIVENPRAHKGPRLLASMPVGTVFCWDSRYSASDFHGLELEQYLGNPAYEVLGEFDEPGVSGGMQMVVFRKTATTPLPAARAYYPPSPGSAREELLGIYYIRSGPAAETSRE